MLNRHKVYLGLAVSASVCAGLSLYLFFRYQQQRAASKAGRRLSPVTDLPSVASPHDHPSAEPTSPTDIENEDSDTVQVLNEIQIPGGGVPLTPDQASILTRFLYEIVDDEERLHRVLTSIANASTFKESQINLANAGCITRLRELLLATENDDTICRILLALNNLPLNDFAIMQFSNVVPIVIGLCRISALNSPLRRYGLTLLINMSVLDYLHDEYMSNIYELGLLVESTTESDDEALSAAKILVNLSNNRANLENLLKLPGVELKFIINLFTSKTDQSNKAEDVLQRFLIFYCNVAEGILQVFKEVGDANNNNNTSWLLNPTPQRKRVLYFEFFDHDKQDLAKSLLRPHHTSSSINTHMKRLYQLMDKIQHSQPKSAVASLETACSTSNSNPNAPSSNEFTQR